MIEIKRSPTADTRTCDFASVTKQVLAESSRQHIADVASGLEFFRSMLLDAAEKHDYDKLEDIAGFHADFIGGFKSHQWFDRHKKKNRHHINNADGLPDDVNLVDVLEFVVDCVMAGMARSGSVYELTLPDDVLKRAFSNTVELLKSQVIVKNGE